MSKQKKPPPKTESLPDLLKPGELFVKETYLRLHRQRHKLTTEEADAKFNSEVRAGTVNVHHSRYGIKIYQKK